MRIKWKVLPLALVLALSVGMFAACGGNQSEQSDGSGQPQTDETNGYGYLCIEDLTVYINTDRAYTFAEITPVFTVPDKAEELTYTYDAEEIKIENDIVTPLKREDATVNVRAESEHFSTTFRVTVDYIPLTGSDADPWYDISEFTTKISANATRCSAVTDDTTIFLGDSFMDDAYIGEYMSSYAADKDVLTEFIDCDVIDWKSGRVTKSSSSTSVTILSISSALAPGYIDITNTCGRLISGMNSMFIEERETMPKSASAIRIIVSTGVCLTENRDIFIRYLPRPRPPALPTPLNSAP